ncbi:hypothetical protein SAMN06265348_103375 [Pedobacter westerhofensis]|uniref:Uncharacterized protein n=1 Tax=Pedobacter westerhofensis TaxID=425512 RepID=A0A521CAK0_9SPHI|nr:hypothetical protein SAMN06265348_103375 [Pedobacter westerhofensis]
MFTSAAIRLRSAYLRGRSIVVFKFRKELLIWILINDFLKSTEEFFEKDPRIFIHYIC